MQGQFEEPGAQITEYGVQQMLQLAERLREASGGELDDSAILAVSEATNTPVEYVRLALRLRAEKKKQSLLARVKAEYLSLDPDVRKNVAAASFGVLFGICQTASVAFSRGDYGIFGVVQIILVSLALYNVVFAKDSRAAAIASAIFCAIAFISTSLFSFLFQVGGGGVDAFLLVPITLGGALLGMLVHRLVAKNRGKLGLKDPVQERQELLRQLVQIQDKLRSDEQSITFLSIDIVGSTQIKAVSDPLSVEFTFNEYHQFVDMIARKYGGRVHSTAGDGMTLAFDSPHQAFGAARNIQAGMLELNTFRNKTGVPLVLRAGLHCGTVMTPDATDIKTVNFAHVLDIAAHLQKVCPPGGIVVSEAASKMLPGGLDAIGSERVTAQNVEGVVWQPKKGAAPVEGGPPPLPNLGS